jgi:hypothetical protein
VCEVVRRELVPVVSCEVDDDGEAGRKNVKSREIVRSWGGMTGETQWDVKQVENGYLICLASSHLYLIAKLLKLRDREHISRQVGQLLYDREGCL